MAQHKLLTLDPNQHNGTQLVIELNLWKEAVSTGQIGADRPNWATRGTMWVKDTGNPADVKMMFYDGTTDIEIASINATTHQISFGSQAKTTWQQNIGSHFFTVGSVAKFTPAGWGLAKADDRLNLGVAVVSAVSGTNVTFQSSGIIELTGLTPGETYYLSRATDGATTTTYPTLPGTWQQPCFVALTTTKALLLINSTNANYWLGVPLTTSPNAVDNPNRITSASDGSFALAIRRRGGQVGNTFIFEQADGSLLGGWDKDFKPFGLASQQLPVGVIMFYAGAMTPPTGWLVVNGGVIPSQYPILRSLFIDATLPDMRQKMPLGAGFSDGLLSTGGSREVVLENGEMPSHAHGVRTQTVQVVSASSGGDTRKFVSLSTGTVETGILSAAGGGNAHSNMPPYISLLPIIKHD